MESITVELHQAADAEDSYALRLAGEPDGAPRAQRGYGSALQKVVWAVEIQSAHRPDMAQVDWEAVLERVIEAYDMNDPLIADYAWPMRQFA